MAAIAYAILKKDNESVAFGDREEVERCPGCLNILEKWEIPLSGLRLKKRRYDISTTYDGVAVISERMRDWLEAVGITGIETRQLPDDSKFYQLLAKRAVKFDDVRRGVVREDQCPVCLRFDAVARGYPVYLKPGQRVDPLEIVRTDIEFGTSDEQSPILLVGLKAAELLRESGLTGFYLEGVAS